MFVFKDSLSFVIEEVELLQLGSNPGPLSSETNIVVHVLKKERY